MTDRKKDLGQVFTPSELVNRMLDKLPLTAWDDPTKTFIDPTCGEGAFLVEVLKRKLAAGHEPLQALSTIYGVELLEDTAMKCRFNLYDAACLTCLTKMTEAWSIIDRNIVCADALTYDFEFDK